jgi:lipopolysaccharide transport system ATP-binding protein
MIEFPESGLKAPDGSIIGVIEEGSRGLRAPDVVRIGPDERIPDQPGNFILDHTFSKLDAVAKTLAVSRLTKLRRAGASVVVLTHDEQLLEKCADEIWWLRDGKLVGRGEPTEVLEQYRLYVARALRQAGQGEQSPLTPVLRDGDGRAALESVELLGKDAEPTTVWRSGEETAVRVTVRFAGDVADPVIGVMIRTRIGLNVYGTNTELENIHFGPVREGDRVRVTFRFRCDLCPGDYTLTAASHDPDGVWHDWLEDAAAFAVADDRYTAGVANLRAKVVAEVLARK